MAANALVQARIDGAVKEEAAAVRAGLNGSYRVRCRDIGPSDYVPWQDDNKIAFIRMEGRGFGDTPLEIELRLSVEDSPNSAGVVIDAIRCAKLGLEWGIGGSLEGPSAYYMKTPPTQMRDSVARDLTKAFILGDKDEGSKRERTGRAV